MDDKVLVALIGAGAGLITGGIASLIAPWVTWGIEKRKEKLAYRRGLIAKWQVMLSDTIPPREFTPDMHEAAVSKGRLPRGFGERLTTYPAYQSLRPYLSKETLAKIDACEDNFYGPEVDEAYRGIQLDVARIQKEWDLA
jgi:hypothetical protein